MESFILIVTLCVPNHWTGGCSSLKTERVPNIPTMAQCRQAEDHYRAHMLYKLSACIPQVK